MTLNHERLAVTSYGKSRDEVLGDAMRQASEYFGDVPHKIDRSWCDVERVNFLDGTLLHYKADITFLGEHLGEEGVPS